jgi:hypothetical protein
VHARGLGVCIDVNVFIWVYMYVYMYVCMCVVCIHIYGYSYTYKHISQLLKSTSEAYKEDLADSCESEAVSEVHARGCGCVYVCVCDEVCKCE